MTDDDDDFPHRQPDDLSSGSASPPPHKKARFVDVANPDEFKRVMTGDEQKCMMMFDETHAISIGGREMFVQRGTFARGSYGRVKQLCERADGGGACPYVAKIVAFSDGLGKTRRECFRMEADISRMASARGFGPRVVDTFECSKFGVIIFARCDTDLAAFITTGAATTTAATAELAAKIYAVVDQMHQAGVYHQDLHVRNIMLVGGDVRVIDFGLAIPIGQPLTPFLRACDLAVLYYGKPDERGQWAHTISMCRPIKMALPPGGISRDAVRAVVTGHTSFAGSSGDCPRDPGTRCFSEHVYKHIFIDNQFKGVAAFLQQVKGDPEWSPYVVADSPSARTVCASYFQHAADEEAVVAERAKRFHDAYTAKAAKDAATEEAHARFIRVRNATNERKLKAAGVTPLPQREFAPPQPRLQRSSGTPCPKCQKGCGACPHTLNANMARPAAMAAAVAAVPQPPPPRPTRPTRPPPRALAAVPQQQELTV